MSLAEKWSCIAFVTARLAQYAPPRARAAPTRSPALEGSQEREGQNTTIQSVAQKRERAGRENRNTAFSFLLQVLPEERNKRTHQPREYASGARAAPAEKGTKSEPCAACGANQSVPPTASGSHERACAASARGGRSHHSRAVRRPQTADFDGCKIRQDKTRQDKTRQDKTRQDKARQEGSTTRACTAIVSDVRQSAIERSQLPVTLSHAAPAQPL